MFSITSNEVILGLFDLIDERLCIEYSISIDEYNSEKISMYIYSKEVLSNILKDFKFKNIISMDDYSEFFPKIDRYDDTDFPADMEYFKKIGISEKFNSVVLYTGTSYGSYHCLFIIDKYNFKKFITKANAYIQYEDCVNMFSSFDFKHTAKNQYFEIGITRRKNREDIPIEVTKHKIEDENLIFDKDSQIYLVMNDIELFFTKETKNMYKTIDIPYKRGIILYGDPGNGKSAMIREIIRRLPKKIVKVIISPGIRNITEVLSSLVEKLNGRESIIVIEDIDSLITDYNRSEFLNILDGVSSKYGAYFIGTTNYPDRIDPAFMNRSGRFDRTFEIGNPSEKVRKLYFESHNVAEIFKEFKLSNNENNNCDIINLFTKYSENMSMANLKELILSVKMELVRNLDTTCNIEDAIKNASKQLIDSRENHTKSYNKNNSQSKIFPYRFDTYNEN